METRLLIAYLLIAVLAAAAALFAWSIIRKQDEHRRIMRGQGRYKDVQGTPKRSSGH